MTGARVSIRGRGCLQCEMSIAVFSMAHDYAPHRIRRVHDVERLAYRAIQT
jgi:hypothetical protein